MCVSHIWKYETVVDSSWTDSSCHFNTDDEFFFRLWSEFCNVLALQDILAYHRRSCHRLTTGLYLGYLKLSSSVDQIKVLVSQRTPNMLCHTRIRENGNVSRSELAEVFLSFCLSRPTWKRKNHVMLAYFRSQ